jgi:hypothetical protein
MAEIKLGHSQAATLAALAVLNSAGEDLDRLEDIASSFSPATFDERATLAGLRIDYARALLAAAERL